jgi:hypothetical protein
MQPHCALVKALFGRSKHVWKFYRFCAMINRGLLT